MIMNMWLDDDLSLRLPALRVAGEGQTLEFKREVPTQVRDLAKEIAAFASSNEGLILVGVADDGSVSGVSDADRADVRDALVQRLVGLCSKSIDPPVRPAFSWATESDRVVLGIRVEKGSQPLYYVQGVPYIRHSSVSRPANPAEVIEAVRAHLDRANASGAASPHAQLMSILAKTLVVVLRWGSTDSELRGLKPWVDEWMGDAEQTARTLRDLASESSVIEQGLDLQLQRVAERLDAVADFTHMLGNGEDFDHVSMQAYDAALELMTHIAPPGSMSQQSSNIVQEEVGKTARKLTELWRRGAAKLFDGTVEDVMEQSGRIGRQLMEFSHYPLDLGGEERLLTLREIGLRLLRLEGLRMYSDGGNSQRNAVAEGASCAEALTKFAGGS